MEDETKMLFGCAGLATTLAIGGFALFCFIIASAVKWAIS